VIELNEKLKRFLRNLSAREQSGLGDYELTPGDMPSARKLADAGFVVVTEVRDKDGYHRTAKLTPEGHKLVALGLAEAG
jgi:hypothetical protein